MFHVKHDGLGSEAQAVGVPLDDEALGRLAAFEALLLRRAVPSGFIAAGDAGAIRQRHVLDCLRAAPLLDGLAADLGSGSGLPGIVLAVARPDVVVHLIEAHRRRLAFLELAVERLGLSNAVPVGSRVEELAGRYDRVLARAFADARTSWSSSERLLASGGSLVYFAGARFRPKDVDDLGAGVRIVPPPALLASAGPLVIMTRQ